MVARVKRALMPAETMICIRASSLCRKLPNPVTSKKNQKRVVPMAEEDRQRLAEQTSGLRITQRAIAGAAAWQPKACALGRHERPRPARVVVVWEEGHLRARQGSATFGPLNIEPPLVLARQTWNKRVAPAHIFYAFVPPRP
jgi:hypothetical protein